MNSKNNIKKVLAIVLSMAIAIVVISFPSTAFAQYTNFTATLSGQEEVPPTQSIANGTAEFSPSTNQVSFFINATNILNTTAAHIHLAPQGQNGPIIVTLVDFSAPTDQYSLNGTAFTAENLEGPMQGQELTNLIRQMNDGNTYVNIHTTQNPNGEIRGQIGGFVEVAGNEEGGIGTDNSITSTISNNAATNTNITSSSPPNETIDSNDENITTSNSLNSTHSNTENKTSTTPNNTNSGDSNKSAPPPTAGIVDQV